MASFGFRLLTTLSAGVALATASRAQACGGFFCSSANPVNQAAERIIFAQDGDTTTQIVEILYEGPANRFAWVLPVPGTPDVAVSSSIVFDRLQSATNPSYQLIDSFDCPSTTAESGPNSLQDPDFVLSPDATVVSVLDQGSVGPYDFQTIGVDANDDDAASVAVQWLQENGYDVDDAGADLLRPYLESGLNLLAVRLQSGLSTGSIQPLSLTFGAEQPTIPIRPTAVAANDDMGVLVWVLGASRAVPTNYKGLELNELLIDWINPGRTYDQVVSIAADEAGGQGFVTEFADIALPLRDAIDTGAERISSIDYEDATVAETVELLAANYGAYDGFPKVLSEQVTFRDDLTATEFLACSYCYFHPEEPSDWPALPEDAEYADYGDSYDAGTDPIGDTDVPALMAAVQEQVLDPILDAAALFETHDYVTRLYTTMSAGEMDVDPRFDFNADLAAVSNLHTAQRRLTCDGTEWKVTFDDGRVVYGEDSDWPLGPVATPDVPFNARVVSFKTSGAATVEVDNSDRIGLELRGLDASTPNGVEGCSVSRGKGGRGLRSGGVVTWALALAGSALARARRGRRGFAK